MKAEIRVMFVQAKEHEDCQRPAEDEEARSSFFPFTLRGNQPCQHLDLRLLPPDPGVNTFLLSKAPGCGPLFWQP